jgi:hypothetical protein
MPFGCPALDALDDVTALRSEAEMAARRIARRDVQSRVLPPGSRDDLALLLDTLRRMQAVIELDARPTISQMYRLRIGH